MKHTLSLKQDSYNSYVSESIVVEVLNEGIQDTVVLSLQDRTVSISYSELKAVLALYKGGGL